MPRLYNNSVRTSQETHYVSATETNRLMLFEGTAAVYCENHTEHIKYTVWAECKGFRRIQFVPHTSTLRLRYKDQPVNVV
jgi:hypothetical protein